MFAPLSRFAGISTLALAAAAAAQPAAAQTTSDRTILVLAQAAPQDVPGTNQSVPPSEAAEPRAPANPAIRTYPASADGHGVKMGGYNTSRWAEDWSVLRDPAKRNDPIDTIKYIPFDAAGDIYLTLSGEARFKVNYLDNPGLTKGENRREDMLRLMGGADLHAGPLRFFGELNHAGYAGHNLAGTASAKSSNELVVQQAFAELSGPVGSLIMGVRYGRQEFTDGPPLMVSQLDNSTVRQVLNGWRGWVQHARLRVGGFDFKDTDLGVGGTSDDIIDDGHRFSGVTAGVVLPAIAPGAKLFLDPFVWREREDGVKWGGMTGDEKRWYYGARLWGSVGSLKLDWTLNHQDGSFRDRDIDAWQFFVAQTYAFGDVALEPTVGIHFDYGSGGDYANGPLKSAATPFGGNLNYSYQGALTITNLFQIAPNLTIKPVDGLKMTGEYIHYLRASEDDAVYRSSGSPYAGTQALDGKVIGDSLRLYTTYAATERLSLAIRYEYFMPGDLLEKLNYAGSHNIAAWTSFRF